jgi:membrane-associated phospholipid phosphatase
VTAAPAALRRCIDNFKTVLIVLARPARGPKQHTAPLSWPMTWQQVCIDAGIALAIFFFLMVFIDAAAIRGVAHLPRWIVRFFNEITDYGKGGWFLWPLGLFFVALAALPPMLPRVQQLVVAAVVGRVGFLFVAIGLPGLFGTIIKRVIGRARPMVTGAIDPYAFSPFIWRADYASLPSGHTTTAFAALVAIGTLWPRARTVMWIYALLIAASRVVVTAHYPSDVFAGAIVGTVGALMVRRWFALRHLGFSLGPDGAVRQWPGPSLRRIKAVARGLLSE